MAHLCNRHTAVLIVSIHFVSVRSLSTTADSYGRHAPVIIDVFVQLPFQQLEESGHGEEMISVGHCYLPGLGSFEATT